MAKTARVRPVPTRKPSVNRQLLDFASTLARRSGVLDMEVAPLAMHSDERGYYEDLEAIRAEYVRRQVKVRADWPQDVSALIEQVADRSLAVKLSDAVGAVQTLAQDAGYLYGLAMGLLIAKGGAQ